MRCELPIRVPHLPLAYAITAATLGDINMNVTLVIAVRSRPEHGGKARTGAAAHSFAELAGGLRVGQSERMVAGKPQRAHVERIALAVLRHLGARHIVAAATIIRSIVIDAFERSVMGAQR